MSRADGSSRGGMNGHCALLALGLTLFLCAKGRPCQVDDLGSGNQGQPAVRPEKPAGSRSNGAAGNAARGKKRAHDAVFESDNWTFRPTVLIRRGSSQGSGTIIASLDGESLVLTAAHVIRGQGPISVELHRYNLGIEHLPSVSGKWPRQVVAESVASDATADLAILRVRDMVALPFVARLGPEDKEPPSNAGLTSVGIDLGAKLSSWNTRLVEVLWFELNDSGTDRPFLVTARIPEHGRSGGGLFDNSGKLVGVCVGHAELVKGRRMGVFSSVENVRHLIREHELTSVIDRSEARLARLAQSAGVPGRHLTRPSRSAVTPTEAKDEATVPQP
jgi:S1-C subfamily serine protease